MQRGLVVALARWLVVVPASATVPPDHVERAVAVATTGQPSGPAAAAAGTVQPASAGAISVRLSRILEDLGEHARQADHDLLGTQPAYRPPQNGRFGQTRRNGRASVIGVHGQRRSGVLSVLALGCLAAIVALAALHPLLAVAAAVPYLTALAIETAYSGPGLDWRRRALLPAALVVTHAGWVVGCLTGLVESGARRAVTTPSRPVAGALDSWQ